MIKAMTTDASALSQTIINAMDGHMARLGVWAAASVVGGILILIFRRRRESWKHFAFQCAAWGLIDGVIVLVSLFQQPKPFDSTTVANLREFLWFNEGLNLGYIGVGLALALAARRKAAPFEALEGAGWGVVLQGLALLTLDTTLVMRLPGAAAWN